MSISFEKEIQAAHEMKTSNENSKTRKSAFKLFWFFLCISVALAVEELLQLYEELEQTSSFHLNLDMNL